MQLNGLNLVDVASVIPYYVDKGLSIELLRMCNSQEFRFIDGYGKGYFLMTQDITSENVTFTVGSRTVSLKVIDKLSLEHPNYSGIGLRIYVTAEPKYKLSASPARRNYNVTIDKSVPKTGNVSSLVTVDPDCPKTLQEIIDDLLPEGYTLVYDSIDLVPYDVNIDGMSTLSAIDYLCSVYGLIWTADGTTVYVWDMVSDISSSSTSEGILGQLYDPINDIRYTEIEINPTNVNVNFPVYNYCRELPDEYYVIEDITSGQGYNLNILDPFLPAVINNNTELPSNTEDMDLSSRADIKV
jgi:hypothetical protein